jgi:hypothetical protein
MRAVWSTIAAAPALFVAVGALVLTACEKGETGGPGARPGPDPHGSAAQEWVARPPPLPSWSPYISDVVTPGCTDGQARFELWLSGWGGEAWATASVGSVNESIRLESAELTSEDERWEALLEPGVGTALSCDGASEWTVAYDAYSLDFAHADCVVLGPGASAYPDCVDASAW